MSCLGARLDDLVDGRLTPELAEQALSHVAGVRALPGRAERPAPAASSWLATSSPTTGR